MPYIQSTYITTTDRKRDACSSRPSRISTTSSTKMQAPPAPGGECPFPLPCRLMVGCRLIADIQQRNANDIIRPKTAIDLVTANIHHHYCLLDWTASHCARVSPSPTRRRCPGIQSERHEIQRGWSDGARNAREPSEAGSSVAVDGVMAGIDWKRPFNASDMFA